LHDSVAPTIIGSQHAKTPRVPFETVVCGVLLFEHSLPRAGFRRVCAPLRSRVHRKSINVCPDSFWQFRSGGARSSMPSLAGASLKYFPERRPKRLPPLRRRLRPGRNPPLPPRATCRSVRGALTLLATLQREARLVDFLKESLADYSDAQIGAAVRDIHRDAAGVLDRLFGIRPIAAAEEGAEIQAPADADRYRLIGTVRGAPPHRGKLVHHGWEAARCEVAEWSGNAAAALVIAPVEVELLP
jgi:hypothetical protein